MRPKPDEVLDRVVAMAATEWPTTEPERRVWFASFGMPAEGQLVTERSRLTSRSRQYVGPISGDWPQTGWHIHRDRFVGVHWFLWAGEDGRDTLAAAEQLRALFSSCWPTTDEATGLAGGFTASWDAGTAEVNFYYHAPREDPRPGVVPSLVQLHVDHRARAADQELEATIGSVLENHWDPIGLYAGPLELQPPEGEYDRYVGWITDQLHAGGGRPEILAELRRAREWMGLEHLDDRDEQAVSRTLECWREYLARLR